MPNVKIYVDRAQLADGVDVLAKVLKPMRVILCDVLGVTPVQCHLLIVPVVGIADQPAISIEFQYLGTPKRNRELINSLCLSLRKLIADFTQQENAAVRATPLDPATYVALK